MLRLVLAAVQTCFNSGDSAIQPASVLCTEACHGCRACWTRTTGVSWLMRSEGPIFVPLTVKDGIRVGTRELICDAKRRMPDRLTVKLHALATRVLLEGNRAIGVEFLDGEHLYRADPLANQSAVDLAPMRARARYEVILACGTFNTPQLLMLSGIGPNEELMRHDIKINVALDCVGKNLQDRLEIGVVHRMHEDFAILKNAQLQTYDLDFVDWLNGQGLYATNGVVLAIIKRSNLGLLRTRTFSCSQFQAISRATAPNILSGAVKRTTSLGSS